MSGRSEMQGFQNDETDEKSCMPGHPYVQVSTPGDIKTMLNRS